MERRKKQYLSIFLYLSNSLFIYSSIYIYISNYLSICLSIYPYVRLASSYLNYAFINPQYHLQIFITLTYLVLFHTPGNQAKHMPVHLACSTYLEFLKTWWRTEEKNVSVHVCLTYLALLYKRQNQTKDVPVYPVCSIEPAFL